MGKQYYCKNQECMHGKFGIKFNDDLGDRVLWVRPRLEFKDGYGEQRTEIRKTGARWPVKIVSDNYGVCMVTYGADYPYCPACFEVAESCT